MRVILKTLWKQWKKIAHTVSLWQAKIILTVVYLLLTPMGIAFHFQKTAIRWQKKTSQTASLATVREQY